MRASIIIVTYNQLTEATIPCVESIYKFTDINDFELIIVDNNSVDGSQHYLKSLADQYKNVKIRLNNVNKGFGGGNNDGLRIASGNNLILLNNDTLVTPDWLNRLLKPIETNPEIGLIGPISNYSGRESKIFLKDISENNYIELSQEYTNKQKGSYFETNMLSFFCIAMRRDVFEKVGYFDENFVIGMFEDDDYCKRIKEACYKLIVLEGCFIYHKGSKSFSKLTNDQYSEVLNKNKEYYFKKHNIIWTYGEVAIAYWEKIKNDIYTYSKKLNNIDPDLERILVRMDDFKFLLSHINNIEKDLNNKIKLVEGTRKKKSNIKEILKKITFINLMFKGLKLIRLYRINGFRISYYKLIEKIAKKLKKNLQIDTNPYNHINLLKDIKLEIIDRKFKGVSHIPFSIVTTIKNESEGIIKYLKSIESQTLIPQELIIVDGGSTDNSIELIKGYQNNSKLNIKLIEGNNLNVPQGRNVGILESKNEILVFTDAGSYLENDFCCNLISCFDFYKNADLISGITYPKPNVAGDWIEKNYDKHNFSIFLPSARAMAVKKSICKKIGLFPEYLITGEDTYFDIKYRQKSKLWVINKKAFVYWDGPVTPEASEKLIYSYGIGDGESGIGDFQFYSILKKYKETNQLNDESITTQNFFKGYLKGRENRFNIEKNVKHINDIVLILSYTPFYYSKGRMMETKLAINYIKKNYKVIFISLSLDYMEKEKVYFDIDLSLLELYHIDDFYIDDLIERYGDFLNDLKIFKLFSHQRFDEIIDRFNLIMDNKRKSKIVIKDTSPYEIVAGEMFNPWRMGNPQSL